jgi:5-methylcytosine-specific restriction endonuclease McrA
MEIRKEEGKKRYLGNCLMCRSPIGAETHSISYCSETCRHKHQIAKKSRARASQAQGYPSVTKKPKGMKRKTWKVANLKMLQKRNEILMAKLRDATRPVAGATTRKPHPFYDSTAWRELRYRVIKAQGRRCMACGSTSKTIHVDHIKPRSKHPELELEFSNLQVLCVDCNLGKSNKDHTDWRALVTTGKDAR